MISVLVVDDSFLMRKLIGDILSTDPDVKVIGTASDGEEALQLAKKLKPDVITMDLEMPKVDGLAATRKILEEAGPRPIVIMLSAFTRENADVTFDCLRAGAFDCILKPSGPLSLDIQRVQRELIRQVKAAAHSKVAVRSVPKPGPADGVKRAKRKGYPLVIIGASTGGPPVLEELFTHIPEELGAAVIVVQHMPQPFTASLATRLDRLSSFKVKLAEDGEVLKPGVAYVVPGDVHLALEEHGRDFRLTFTSTEPVHGMRPSVDVVMQNVARVYTGPLVGVLLTGMGEDGRDGMLAIHQKGGVTIAQSPDTCVVDGMVRSAIEAGSVDEILQPDAIPARLVSFASAS